MSGTYAAVRPHQADARAIIQFMEDYVFPKYIFPVIACCLMYKYVGMNVI